MKRKSSFDADGAHLGYARPSRATSRGFDQLPAGPRSFPELFEWPHDLARRAQQMLKDQGFSATASARGDAGAPSSGGPCGSLLAGPS